MDGLYDTHDEPNTLLVFLDAWRHGGFMAGLDLGRAFGHRSVKCEALGAGFVVLAVRPGGAAAAKPEAAR